MKNRRLHIIKQIITVKRKYKYSKQTNYDQYIPTRIEQCNRARLPDRYPYPSYFNTNEDIGFIDWEWRFRHNCTADIHERMKQITQSGRSAL